MFNQASEAERFDTPRSQLQYTVWVLFSIGDYKL